MLVFRHFYQSGQLFVRRFLIIMDLKWILWEWLFSVVWKNGIIYQRILPHWGRVTHVCVGKPTTIGSDNGLSAARRQATIRTNAGVLLIRPLGTNFGEILFRIRMFSFKKMHLKISSAKWRTFCLGHNMIHTCILTCNSMLWSYTFYLSLYNCLQ